MSSLFLFQKVRTGINKKAPLGAKYIFLSEILISFKIRTWTRGKYTEEASSHQMQRGRACEFSSSEIFHSAHHKRIDAAFDDFI